MHRMILLLLSFDVCALTKSDVMQVRFLLWQSIAISLTLTAMSERTWWEAKGKRRIPASEMDTQ